MKTVLTFTLLLLPLIIYSQVNIKLPLPQKEIGKPLMETLNLRQSTREFKADPLSLQDLSNLLWSGWGINRSETGKRTAPSSRNIQDIEVYVFLQSGVYLYEAKENTLVQLLNEDCRKLTGTQDFVASAPLNLVFISDQTKLSNYSDDDKLITAGADAAFIAQNVYLYCASQNLGTVVRASINKNALIEKLNLRPGQRIILAQTIGYKK